MPRYLSLIRIDENNAPEGGQLSVTDGPFTETKEVIGGYALLQAKDKAEAIEWTKRFLKVHEPHWTVTCEVREIEEG